MDLLVKFNKYKFLFDKNIKFEKHKINKNSWFTYLTNKIRINIKEKNLIGVYLITNKSNNIIDCFNTKYCYDGNGRGECAFGQPHYNFNNDIFNDDIIYNMLYNNINNNILVHKDVVNYIKIEIVLKKNINIGTDITLVKYYNSNIAFTKLVNSKYEFEYEKIKEYFKELNKEVIEYVNHPRFLGKIMYKDYLS